jgi:putative cell wall-binding protein
MFVMSDPRNVAHDKKVTQEKHHKNTEAAPGAKRASRGKKMTAGEKEKEPGESAQAQEAPNAEQGPSDLEKSVAILSKLKEMEFHSRGNIETLAQLTLTIEEELKQGEFSEAIGSIYSAQDAFHSKIAALIETYEAKCEQLKGAA